MKTFSFATAVLVALLSFGASTGVDAGLALFGEGVRSKKVALFFSADVYHAQFFVNDKAKFKTELAKASTLDALKTMDKIQIQLKFLRDLPAAKIRDSFIDALTKNKVDAGGEKMKAFLAEIEKTANYENGKTVTITGDFVKKTLAYVSPDAKTTEMAVSQQDILNIFAIWLGEPADDGLDALKKKLLGTA